MDKKALASGLIAGLLAGGAAGWWAAHARMNRPPQARAEHILKKFSRRLSLDAEQRQKVRQILEAKRQRMDGLRNELEPRLDELRRSASEEIRAVLRPDQIPAFEKLEADIEARRRRRLERERGSPPR